MPTLLEDFVLALFRDDDEPLELGNTDASPNVSILWETADANANELIVSLPAGDSTDVPVMAIGVGILGVDLGLFNGVTQSTFAVVDADRDSFIALDFSADDAARLRSNTTISISTTALAIVGNTSIAGDVTITGTTPLLTIGDNADEDTGLIFAGHDGSSNVNYHMGFDAGTNNLVIGTGSTFGSDRGISMDTSGNMVFGDQIAAVDYIHVYVRDGWTSGGSGGIAAQFAIGGDVTTHANDTNYAALFIAGNNVGSTITTGADVTAGSSAVLATMYLTEPNISTSHTVDHTATLYIQGPASEATNNYALWVDDGAIRLDGTVDASGGDRGFGIGNLAGVERIQYQSGAYSFLTESNAWAEIYCKDITIDGDLEFTGAQEIRTDADALTIAPATGSLLFTGTLALTGSRVLQSYHTDITSTNALTQDSWSASKENINSYGGNALDILDEVDVISFSHLLDRDPSGRIKLGVRAESIQESLALVTQDYGHGLGVGPALDTMGLTALLTKAIQELRAEIIALKES